MATSAFDTLLVQADDAARQGHWSAALTALQQASQLEPDHTGALTGLGTCLIQLDRPAEAVAALQKVTRLAPLTAEAHNNLGVVYTCVGQPAEAEAAFRRALECDQEHVPAWKNLAMLCLRLERLDEGVPILASLVKSHPDDAEALGLLAECYEIGDDPASALFLYQRALALQPADARAQAALARLAPKPAPVDRIAKPEHAKKLAALKNLKRNGHAPAAPASAPVTAAPAPMPAEVSRPAAIAFYGTGDFSDGVRFAGPGRALAEMGHRIKVTRLPEAADVETYDLLVFSRPHAAPELVEALERAITAGKRYIIDLDDDYQQLPPEHPAYATAGPGNPAGLKLLEAAIRRAAALVVATPGLAERYGAWAKRVVVIPDGWDTANPLWTKPALPRATLNVGWVNTSGRREDLSLIRPELLRLAREFPQVQLVLAGDYQADGLFTALPDQRRLVVPVGAFEDYPYVLAHLDILAAPLRETAYNQARSDRTLMEAGARGLPWVASASPAYKAWGAGGLLVEKSGDWYAALKRLVADAGLRRELSAAGQAKAVERESPRLAARWREV
ncbi:MAG: tetratricopeptide repeat protein [Anaerolineales bacterium]|nr:tetratricopeptide repeat protein [Anaerolineales bacterium]